MGARREAKAGEAAQLEREAAGVPPHDPETVRRVRLTAGVSAVLGAASLLLAAFQLARGGVPAAVIAAAIGVLAWAMVLALRLAVSTRIVATLVLALWTALLVAGAAMRGGPASPAATALAALPMLALLLLGRRGAWIWSTLVVVVNVALVAASRRGVIVDFVDPPLRPAVGATASIVLGGALLSVGLVYERQRSAALTELARRGAELRAVDRARHAAQSEAQMIRAEHLASIGQLAAGASHEINNPLAYVLYNLQALEEHLAGRATLEREESLQIVREALVGARHIQRVVRDLKTYSRAEDDSLEPVDLHAVAESVLKMAANEIRHRAQVVRDYGDVPHVQANRARVGQILLNLVINAAQAIPEGRSRDNTITLTTRSEGADGQVVVEVRDTGVGIPPELLRRVTEPFFTTKPVGIGTGLGLTACVNLVQRLGGAFAIDSEEGAGTTVRFTLPRAERRQPVSTPPPSFTTLPATYPIRLLVVDDDANVTRALRRMLKGYETIFARSGAEALELLRRDDGFDLVLCDLMMPDVTGADVYAALSAENPALASRLVLMTGGAFSGGLRDFITTFPGPVLEKPFAPEALRELIAKAAERAERSA